MKANRTALRALRRANRWGLRELERRTGLTRGYLSRLERGGRGASLDTLTVIAGVYDVPVKDLTSEDLE